MEDPALIRELEMLLWTSKLSMATPAQVLTASPVLQKQMVEKLWSKHIDGPTTSGSSPTTKISHISQEVFGFVEPCRPAFSLPLWEINVLVNGFTVESAIIDQGSQIVAMQADVAHACGAHINTNNQIEMEGANGIKTWTLGCAEDLCMKIGELTFTMHAHVLDDAPFCLLFGQPFYSLLLCHTEDHSDSSVTLTVHDPADPT